MGTIKSHLHRASKALRVELADLENPAGSRGNAAKSAVAGGTSASEATTFREEEPS